MGNIAVLDQQTIDKIAAGEVIERPASVVKELVENSIDAGATSVTVEIKDGGTTFIRITDNGSGIEKSQVSLAFLRHSTSKIRSVEDLMTVASLGFRGEALSSIAAISMVELITKREGTEAGTRYVIEGSVEKTLEEIAAPQGTTFLVRNLFYNTPARKKFLKAPVTEAGYVSDLLERLALSHPDISFQFINNGQTKLHSTGNHNLKDVIYHIFGRDIANNLIEIEAGEGPVKVTGFIGKPMVSRGNRNYENYFINGRYIKSSILAKAIEDSYKTFMMQHKYPFTALHFTIDGSLLDVNVHPTKMELRFSNQEQMYHFVEQALKEGLTRRELIPQVSLAEKPGHVGKSNPAENPNLTFPRNPAEKPEKEIQPAPVREEGTAGIVREHNLAYFMEEMKKRVVQDFQPTEWQEKQTKLQQSQGSLIQEKNAYSTNIQNPMQEKPQISEIEQLEIFTGDKKLLDQKNKADIHMIGQLFDTYWLVQFEEKFYMIDQHAAHEKVLYEQTIKALKTKEYTSQMMSPPLILTLNMLESERLEKYMSHFTGLGFEIEHFGGREYAVRAVPGNLFGIVEKDLFIEMLDGLEQHVGFGDSDLITEKIASMSCKAAVKGNKRMSMEEAGALIEELLDLENPYNCPHGRPTIISMTKQEIEKKFKRIL